MKTLSVQRTGLVLILYLTSSNLTLATGQDLEFDRTSYDLFVLESTPMNSTLTFLTAKTKEPEEIEYRLHGDQNRTFYLNSSSGELILIKAIDYEKTSMFKLTIEARLSSMAVSPIFTQLNVRLLNINDNEPEINLIRHSAETIRFDFQTCSIAFATVHLKDFDSSTKHLSLSLDQTEEFQLKLLRENHGSFGHEAIYVVSTTDHCLWKEHRRSTNLKFESCDNDSPILCSNRSYSFDFQSNDLICYLSFNVTTIYIDLVENLPVSSLIYSANRKNLCEKILFSIDDSKNFRIDPKTGDLTTLKMFNRTERSLYRLILSINRSFSIRINVRIIDAEGKKPFLTRKMFQISRRNFEQIQIFNSTLCRSKSLVEDFFEISSNCTVRSLVLPPPIGRFRFVVELNQTEEFRDEFLIEFFDENPTSILLVAFVVFPFIASIVLLVFIIRKFFWNDSTIFIDDFQQKKTIQRGNENQLLSFFFGKQHEIICISRIM